MKNGKTSKKFSDSDFNRDDASNWEFQGKGYHGSQGNMDVYSEKDGYFGSVSPFYGDLPEEEVDTEAIDKEFQDRYSRLFTIAKRVLTPDQYRIFDLYFVQTKTQAEIARAIGASQPYVAKTSTRILEILRLHEGDIL